MLGVITVVATVVVAVVVIVAVPLLCIAFVTNKQNRHENSLYAYAIRVYCVQYIIQAHLFMH